MPASTGRTRLGDDSGATLVMALVFVMVLGLGISLLLTQASVQFRAADVYETRRDGVFAADAGIEHALATAGLVSEGGGTPSTCQSAIELRRSDEDSSSSGSSFTLDGFLLDDPPGSGRLVVVAVAQRGDTDITSVTIGGVPLTQSETARLTSSSRTSRTELFYGLDASLPAAGSHQVRVTAASSGNYTMNIASFVGVAQTGIVTKPGSVAQSSDWIQTTIGVPVADSLVFSAASSARSGGSVSPGTTGYDALESTSGSNFMLGSSWNGASPAGSVTVQENFSSDANPATHVLLSAGPLSQPCPQTPQWRSGGQRTIAYEFFVNWFDFNAATYQGFQLNTLPGYNRMLAVAVNTANNPLADVEFGGASMHRAVRAVGDNSSEIWYLLDAELPGPGSYDITLRGAIPGPSFAVHVSSWMGVLQEVSPGVPYAPTGYPHSDETLVASITTSIFVDSEDALVLSAAGHNNGSGQPAGVALPTGTTQLTNGPALGGMSFGTSSGLSTGAGDFAVTESFAGTGTPTTHVLAAFRPASWQPQEFGAECEDHPVTLDEYNGFHVGVVCTVDHATDTLTITATATNADGAAFDSTATIQRQEDGSVEITGWSSRPDAVGPP